MTITLTSILALVALLLALSVLVDLKGRDRISWAVIALSLVHLVDSTSITI